MKQPVGTATYQASFPVQLATAGTAACIADFITYPLDTAKVRLQVSNNDTFNKVEKKIVNQNDTFKAVLRSH